MFRTLSAITFAAGLAACEQTHPTPDDGMPAPERGGPDAAFGEYYVAMPAEDRPLIRMVNREATRCGDGSVAAACPAGTLDYSLSGIVGAEQQARVQDALASGHLLLRGVLQVDPAGGDDGAMFRVTEAWTADTGQPIAFADAFVRVRDEGPCPDDAPCDFIENRLNTPGGRALISELAFGDHVEDDAMDRALSMAETEDGVIVAGGRYAADQGARGRVVNEFYVRVPGR